MANKHNEHFDCFARLVEYLLPGGRLLPACKAMSTFSPSTIGFTIQAARIEHDADDEEHQMTKLAREFITPIQREDIIQLAQEIDEVTDRIEDVLMRIYMYNFSTIRPEVFAFTEVISRCCCALKKAVKEFPEFRKSKTIHQFLVDVNTGGGGRPPVCLLGARLIQGGGAALWLPLGPTPSTAWNAAATHASMWQTSLRA